MIRNIPIKYSDDQLKEALEEFKGKYNCLYMPFDFEKMEIKDMLSLILLIHYIFYIFMKNLMGENGCIMKVQKFAN